MHDTINLGENISEIETTSISSTYSHILDDDADTNNYKKDLKIALTIVYMFGLGLAKNIKVTEIKATHTTQQRESFIYNLEYTNYNMDPLILSFETLYEICTKQEYENYVKQFNENIDIIIKEYINADDTVTIGVCNKLKSIFTIENLKSTFDPISFEVTSLLVPNESIYKTIRELKKIKLILETQNEDNKKQIDDLTNSVANANKAREEAESKLSQFDKNLQTCNTNLTTKTNDLQTCKTNLTTKTNEYNSANKLKNIFIIVMIIAIIWGIVMTVLFVLKLKSSNSINTVH